MLRQLALPALRSSLLALRSSNLAIVSSSRALSSTAIRMGEGDTGGVRSGGASSGDAFSRREAASENKYMKDKEMEKLRQLKAKIAEHKKQLADLDKTVDETLEEGKKGGTS